MDITDVRVFPVNEEKLKAFVSIILDDCFVISDIKIINGNNGLFLSMPSKKRKNGSRLRNRLYKHFGSADSRKQVRPLLHLRLNKCFRAGLVLIGSATVRLTM